MRWKALEFLGKLLSCKMETFSFKSNKCSPMVHNVGFRTVRSNFLSKLTDDVRAINNTKNLIVTADESSDFYKINKETYQKYLTNNISKT